MTDLVILAVGNGASGRNFVISNLDLLIHRGFVTNKRLDIKSICLRQELIECTIRFIKIIFINYF